MNKTLIAQQRDDLLNFRMKEMMFPLDSVEFISFDINKSQFSIILENHQADRLEIIYDHKDDKIQTDYIQAFRFSDELFAHEWGEWVRDDSPIKHKYAYYYYLLQYSDFIHWYETVSAPHSMTINQPLEHHVFLTGHEIVEVLSYFKPRFVVQKIKT